jgi:DNA-binding CsgD family transcriptional regulator
VRLLSLGCSVHETAAILRVAPSTIDNHRGRAMKKLGTSKAALLTRVAILTGISSLKDRLTAVEKRRLRQRSV